MATTVTDMESTKALEKRLNALRLKAFRTNTQEDRLEYFSALSRAFQNGELVPASLAEQGEVAQPAAEKKIDHEMERYRERQQDRIHGREEYKERWAERSASPNAIASQEKGSGE